MKCKNFYIYFLNKLQLGWYNKNVISEEESYMQKFTYKTKFNKI